MSEIQVSCAPDATGWRCAVRVADGGRTSTFDVTTSEPDALVPRGGAWDGTDVERFVAETFRFLLEREPVTSILSSFDLTVVARYFPEYPAEIRRRLDV